jgi:murein DD-endopeptidase MepM/ murein hydrolase activator NlpD
MKTLKFYIIILITISFVISQEKSFDQSIKDTENQIKELKNFINMGNNEVKKLQSQSKKTKEILALTKKNINNSNTLIKTYERQISLYNKQLSNLQTAINKNNSTIGEIKKSYEKRSISLYKNKNVGLSNYIFNSQSFSQMIYRLKYFNIISAINQDSVNKIKTTQIYNKQKTKEIELLMSRVESSKSSKKNEIAQLSDKKRYQEKLLSQLKNEERLVKLEIDKQLQQIKSLEQLRKKIIAEKEKYNAQQLASLNKIDRDIRKYKGKLQWPVKGKIVKSFGPQWNPKLNTTLDNPGIDISASATTPVKSVFDGYVSTITFIAGYGTTVIVDHNNSYYTVFTHLENLLITEDINIREGQNIGYVSKENIIHFEIWGNNQKLNPEGWLISGN